MSLAKTGSGDPMPPRPTSVRILILGTGGMAGSHARAFSRIPGVKIVAGVDTRPEALAAFQGEFGVPMGFASLQQALEWGQFDAVSNVTPDAAHHATTLPLLAARKHVLCEKPLATSYSDAREMADRAAEAGVVNMVNLTYRNVPALQEAARLVAAGEIGHVRHFEASYLQSWLTQPAWGDWRTDPKWLWRLSRAHGSNGVLGDVGVHIIDFATFVVGAMPASLSCRLHTYRKAEGDRIGDYVLDANDSFVMEAELTNEAIGTISATRFASGHLNDLRLRVWGDCGGLEVLFEGGKSTLRGCLGEALPTAKWSRLPAPAVPTVYRRFIDAVRGQGGAEPTFERGAALQRVLDAAAQGGNAALAW